MKWRDFIAGVGCAAVWPMAAWGQRSTAVIGFLGPASATGFAPYLKGFQRGLGETGFVEGGNIAVEYRWADNQIDRLPTLAVELVQRPVAVIVTGGATAAALAAKAATSTIPIVFAVGADPIKFGLVASLSRPGGNVTGVSFLSNMLLNKQLELLGEVVPTAITVGVLANPDNPNAASDTNEVKAAADSLGKHVLVVQATTERDFDRAFASLVQRQATALLVLPDVLFVSRREQLAALAARYAMPVIYSNRFYPEAGGLMSYGSDQSDAYRQVGIYTGRILKGEQPANLPVMQSTKFELVINLKAAKALDVTIPPSLLARADEVIE
jgi:putative tryptophan/tyrosine transport system substrate-binding protein